VVGGPFYGMPKIGCALRSAKPSEGGITEMRTPWAPPGEGPFFSNGPLLGCYPALTPYLWPVTIISGNNALQ